MRSSRSPATPLRTSPGSTAWSGRWSWCRWASRGRPTRRAGSSLAHYGIPERRLRDGHGGPRGAAKVTSQLVSGAREPPAQRHVSPRRRRRPGYAAITQARASELGVADRVQMLGHVTERAEIRRAQHAATCSSPRASTKASGSCSSKRWRTGLPVVCYDRGGQVDFLATPTTGAVVKLNDIDGIHASGARSVASPERREEIRRHNLAAVENYLHRSLRAPLRSRFSSARSWPARGALRRRPAEIRRPWAAWSESSAKAASPRCEAMAARMPYRGQRARWSPAREASSRRGRSRPQALRQRRRSQDCFATRRLRRRFPRARAHRGRHHARRRRCRREHRADSSRIAWWNDPRRALKLTCDRHSYKTLYIARAAGAGRVRVGLQGAARASGLSRAGESRSAADSTCARARSPRSSSLLAQP